MRFSPFCLVLLVLTTPTLASPANCIVGCKCNNKDTNIARVLQIQECEDNPINLSKKTLSGVSKNKTRIGFRNVNIENIEKDAFEGFNELETVTFEDSTITKIHPQVFDLPELGTINFAKTIFGEVPNLHSQYLEELIFNDCRLSQVPNLDNLLALSFVNLANNFIDSISESSFNNVTTLEEITLSNNSISKLPRNFLRNNPDINTLNLNHNPLTKFELNFDSSWETLSLRNCKLTTFDRSSSKNLASLTFLDLSGNQIAILPIDAFESMKDLTYFDLSNNKLVELDDDIFLENVKLDKLVLDNNPFETLPSFQTKTNETALQIRTFSCKNCSLKTVKGVFDHMKSLVTLDLSNNQIGDINGAFSEMRELKQLFLSNNKIRNVNINSFDKKTELQTLDLSGNPLVPLDPVVLASLPSLKMLNVSNSNLKKLWSNYNAELPSLEILHIKHNNLSVITVNDLVILPKLKALQIQNNPIICNDDTEILYSYLTKEKTIYPKTKDTHENYGLVENRENDDLKKAWKKVLPSDCIFYDDDDDNEIYDYDEDDENSNYDSTDKNIDLENDDFDDDANVETLMSTDSFSLARASYILSITSVFILTALLVIFVAVMITLLILRRNKNFNMQNGPRLKIPLWHTSPGQKKHSGSVYRPLSEEYSGPRTPIISRYEFKPTPQVHSSVNNI